jgi:DNA-binding NtrC family response regulator
MRDTWTTRDHAFMHSSLTDPQHPTRVLVVDADRRVRASLERLISVADGFSCVRSVDNPTDALAALETQGVDAVLIDPRLPDMEIGLAFLQQAHMRWPDLLLVSMSGTLDVAPASLRDGHIRFVAKSGQPDDLLAALSPDGRNGASGPHVSGAHVGDSGPETGRAGIV